MKEPRRYSARIAAVNSSFLRMSATLKLFRIVASTGAAGGYSTTWQVPPAASMAARADFEKPCAWTVSGLVISPRPSTLTGMSRRVARPAALSAARSTDAPESKRCSRSPRLTGCVCVRNISNGIDIFLFGPRSLRMRMWIGFCPPSKRARSLAPAREPAPLWPRPDVLPWPEPWPRPTRLRFLRDPGAGWRLWRPTIGSSALSSSRFFLAVAINSPLRMLRGAHPLLSLERSSSVLRLHDDQVADRVEHPAQLRRVRLLDGMADLAQADRAQRVALLGVGAVGRADLLDHICAHASTVSSGVLVTSASASAS